MIGTITPPVREAQRQIVGRLVLHVVGAGLGGALLGIALAALGTLAHPIPSSYRLLILLVVGAWATAWQLDLIRWPLPEHRWSVPRGLWLVWSQKLAALVYGIAMGMGIVTHLRFSSFHLLAAWLILWADPLTAIAVGVTYGLARGLSVAALTVPAAAVGELNERARSLQTWLMLNTGRLRLVNGIVSAGVLSVWTATVLGLIR